MLRTIAIPRTTQFILNLPVDLINKKVEFIAFPIEEVSDCNENKQNERISFGLGCMENEIEISNDFNEPLEDFKEYM